MWNFASWVCDMSSSANLFILEPILPAKASPMYTELKLIYYSTILPAKLEVWAIDKAQYSW